MNIPRPIRRLLRPFAPWRLRDRLRRRTLERQVRHNRDISVVGPWGRLLWRALAPDTYRVGSLRRGTPPPGAVAEPDGDPEHLLPLVGADTPVAVAAHAAPPRWRSRGAAARVEPFALAATAEVIADIGATGDEPVPELFDRLTQAGHASAVVPRGRGPQGPPRADRIEDAVAVVLGGVPLHDVGGGSRGAQLAMELLARGFHVAYVARFASWDSGDVGLRHIHPRLEQYAFTDFDAAAFAGRATSSERIAVCELPVAEYAAAVEVLAAGGFATVYDLVDDWSDRALGLDWYQPATEKRLVSGCDAAVASAAPLVRYLERQGVAATLVPNGVNERLFSGEPGERPADLPEAATILGYHGSLYGDWFDWAGLAAVASAYPDAAVTIIGDTRETPPLPPNVHFLGPKPQFQLAAYIGHYSVGLVPFTVTPTTHAVSPLKAFECLAMGVPVAAPPLEALAGVDGVHTDDDLTAAVSAALAASPPDGAAARRSHGWGRLVGDLLGAVGMVLPEPTDPAPRLVLRPVRRYTPQERRL